MRCWPTSYPRLIMSNPSEPILPGATIGVLGGGQLGRMFAIAAQRMGYFVHVYCGHDHEPAAQVASKVTCGALDDFDALEAFASSVAACTLEWENIPAEVAERVAARTPLRPGPFILHTVQHRLREKTFLSEHDLPVVPFADIQSLADLEAGIERLGVPCVLKTAASGYDGKGQVKICAASEAAAAWESVAGVPCVLEAWVSYEAECSIIAGRSPSGETRCYPLFHNEHANHILDVSTCPGPFDERVAIDATELAERVLDAFQYEGLICIEFFLEKKDRLIINEIAPRPHNSGHLTLEAARTSQFEQQVRAVCNLPLGDPQLVQPAAMVNLLGDLWAPQPDWLKILAESDCALHLYGKEHAMPGRKMGHLTCRAETGALAREKVIRCRGLL